MNAQAQVHAPAPAESSVGGGCGSGACQCGGGSPVVVPSINGASLHLPEAQPDAFELRELAYAELLRQQAVAAGLLAPSGLTAPVLTPAEREIIEAMVDAAIVTPEPTVEECQRYYDANKSLFVVGNGLYVRHILFAVTPGVNVEALCAHAEKVLLQLLVKDVAPDRFAQLAAEMSNCPTSTQGGDLGWIGPSDCAPELANVLFHTTQSEVGIGDKIGVHPRLIPTRYGFHIIEVLQRRKGEQKSFAEVRESVFARLMLQSRAKALHQYMSLLVGQARIVGLDLEGSQSPLVQ